MSGRLAGGLIDTEMFSSFRVESSAIEQLREAGYSPETLELHAVAHDKPDEDSTAHIVAKVRCLSKPLEDADASVDEIELWTCSCRGYLFHRMRRSPGDDEILSPPQIDAAGDKHIQTVAKHLRAEVDQGQGTLI